MSSFPTGNSGIQGPQLPEENSSAQETEPKKGQHASRQVHEVPAEKQLLAPPFTSSRKSISDFNSIKTITPETSTQTVSAEQAAPSDRFRTKFGRDRYNFQDKIIASAKKTKAWESLDKQVTKKEGLTSKKKFKKLLGKMPKMSFEDKNTVSLLSLYALDKLNSGKFTQEQFNDYMSVFMDCYAQAKTEEQIQQALKTLPSASEQEAEIQPLSQAVLLAEVATMALERGTGEDARNAAYNAIKTDLQTDLYDKNSEFLGAFTGKLESYIDDINEGIAEGMTREITRMVRKESGNKKVSLTPNRRSAVVRDIDSVVNQFVVSQLRERNHKIEQAMIQGKPISPITDQILQKASVRRKGIIDVLAKTTGLVLQDDSSFHEIVVNQAFHKTLNDWVDTLEMAQRLAAEKNNIQGHELENWSDQLLELIPEGLRDQVDMDELHEGMKKKYLELDIQDGLIASVKADTPFSRADPKRKAFRGSKSGRSAKTVSEVLEQGVKKKLAQRAAKKAKAELQISRPRPSIESEKPVSETSGAKTSVSRNPTTLEDDGVVPTLIRQFELMIAEEKLRASSDPADRTRLEALLKHHKR